MGDLFDSSVFMPRAQCGPGWSTLLRSVSEMSNTTIWLCYMLIPFGVVGIYRRIRAGKPLKGQLVGCILFVSFIALCGTTHFMDRLMFNWPIYRVTALVLVGTAIVSLATVCWLFVAGAGMSSPTLHSNGNGSNGNGSAMIDVAKRGYLPLVQVIGVAGAAIVGALYINDRFDAIDRKFDRVEFKLESIDAKVANPVTVESLKRAFKLLKAYNQTLIIPENIIE